MSKKYHFWRLGSEIVVYLQQLSNCVRTLDTYYATGGSTLVTNTYTTAISSCQMTAPVNGYYNVCVHAR